MAYLWSMPPCCWERWRMLGEIGGKGGHWPLDHCRSLAHDFHWELSSPVKSWTVEKWECDRKIYLKVVGCVVTDGVSEWFVLVVGCHFLSTVQERRSKLHLLHFWVPTIWRPREMTPPKLLFTPLKFNMEPLTEKRTLLGVPITYPVPAAARQILSGWFSELRQVGYVIVFWRVIGWFLKILLMDEILHHLGWLKLPINNGIIIILGG